MRGPIRPALALVAVFAAGGCWSEPEPTPPPPPPAPAAAPKPRPVARPEPQQYYVIDDTPAAEADDPDSAVGGGRDRAISVEVARALCLPLQDGMRFVIDYREHVGGGQIGLLCEVRDRAGGSRQLRSELAPGSTQRSEVAHWRIDEKVRNVGIAAAPFEMRLSVSRGAAVEPVTQWLPMRLVR